MGWRWDDHACNFMRDDMNKGDLVLFIHSKGEPPRVVGVATVTRDGYPDPTAFDLKDSHFDPKSDPENPRWIQVELRLKRKRSRLDPLSELKLAPQADWHALTSEGPALQKGQRLSSARQ